MTEAEAVKRVEQALDNLRSAPKYAAIRRRGAPIPKGLDFRRYQSMGKAGHRALYARVWKASKAGKALKFIRGVGRGGRVVGVMTVVMIPSDYAEGADYAKAVYGGGTFAQAAAGTGQAILPLGPANATATWDMNPSEVAAGNVGWGALAETFLNPFSPRWLPTQMVRGVLGAVLE